MRHWMSLSLGRKLSIMIMVSTLVPLLSLGAFTYLISSNVTEEKIKQSGIDTLEQMEGKLRFVIGDIENISMFLIGQSDIQQYLSQSEENEELKGRILNLMLNLSSSKKYILNITVYPKKFNTPLSNSTIYSSNLDDLINLYDVKEKMWTGIYTISNYSGKHQVISFIRPLRSIYTYENLGWMVISLDETFISEYWSEPHLGDGRGQVALLNETGNVLSSTEREWLTQPFDEIFPGATSRILSGKQGETDFGEGQDRKTILYYHQPITDWTLVGTIPNDLYSSQNRFILLLTAIAVVIMVVINAGLVLFVIQRVTNPLRVLTRLLTKVNPDGPMPTYYSSSRDEIGRLGESYNMLGSHIKELKQQFIRDEARKKEADIRALQAQINPHFLYNTLSSIHWMALRTEDRRIADMVGALSDFLQFSLNKGSEYCPVHQEIAHIRNYAQVQSIRYPNKFEVDINVDPALNDKIMLKLLLQPLLENAMIHGIQKKTGKGTIGIYLEQSGHSMNVLVIDDGIGMEEHRLQYVRDIIGQTDGSYSPGASYGLRNVNERLRLHYGPMSRLTIESRLHAGTRISFTIPFLEVPYENHDRG
ncbi:sensor histidine kinase [Cohnella cholangitidis]|uniref:Sensor histidine kinase n=1 Tax=Cohnella cholangitidis TaxID=2598458 RepID=A0A7G5BSR9_9BACL|nr:sensor histidine kinase [Cohnella cholangitidis]QMV40003.1 sensor histidine kinase [Cohnella cholangitidis]